ncbi:DUF2834 domain-containing protein [Bernardetia sp.]|uniref:DUF2834 domain-containing protein n=1 Tax=Bernardetia sp. TaxID=1937974 RepID=UPI00345AE131
MFPACSCSVDLVVIVIAFFAWYILRSKKLKMKYWWMFIPLMFLVAIVFGFPMFLYFRELRLEKLNQN